MHHRERRARPHLIRSKKTNPFHRLCNSIEGRRFLVLAKTGSSLCTLKCARANATALRRMDQRKDMYLVREGRRKPLNTISSHTGAQTETTTAYRAIATGSRANIDCSTLETPTGEDDTMGTSGNMTHPRTTSSCQFPLRLKRNQPAVEDSDACKAFDDRFLAEASCMGQERDDPGTHKPELVQGWSGDKKSRSDWVRAEIG
ncbi:unnamed protein product [Spirodela intermedia]|uniref:Uncharacterized protein n=1 Tax=Spirodela intermedia TaxID=51605 RepID=A0A7I8J785_SPIIN|nr:unnamed protein product [Spirodela intermedia]CAA6665929.1 unnamed protein product [Spirodela intermedia]